MPNLIHTVVTVTGPSASVTAFQEKAASCGAQIFSFEAFIPMPKELDVERSSDTQMADLVYNGGDITEILTYAWVRYAGITDRAGLIDLFDMRFGTPGGMREVAATLQANRVKYGVKDWREWRGKYWGTSHDVMDVKIAMEVEGGRVYLFDTAWTCPTAALVEISRQYPELRFTAEFRHEQKEFYYVMSWEAGQCVHMMDIIPAKASQVLPAAPSIE